MQHAGHPVTRTLEPGITLFSGAEIRVVLLPVGEAAEAVFQRYASLIVRHRQVELTNVRSFYKEAQKSPFKFFPWKTGNMHFKFVPEDVALQPCALAPLHNHRRVLGVIGVMHCPDVQDIAKAYQQFEQRCKAFPDAFTVRCFAFEPSDEQIQEDRKGQRNFIMFPPGDWEQLDNHAEVVMHDFAACLLAELERWMLNASPAMVELSGGLVDAPEFTGASGALEAVQTRLYSDEELKTKKRYGRLQKAMGDYCLLAGSPLDAQDHYSTAVELGRTTQDWIYMAAALEGFAAAKVLHAAITNGAFAINQSSVFNDEQQWRTPRKDSLPHGGGGGGGGQQQQQQQGKAAGGTDGEGDGNLSVASSSRSSSSAFGGAQFWAALRGVDKLEGEVRGLVGEAKGAIRRRGGQPLLVEADLMLARFLAGMHGGGARREVSDLVSGLQLAAEMLPLPEDRLLTFVEGAQVLGLVGSSRKRVLLLWQAVELSKFLGFPSTRTLDVARKALEPPDDPTEPDSDDAAWSRVRPLSQSAVPRSWPQVRAGCLEAVLGLAIYAKQHADVWDAAAALLREHPSELSAHRQQSLLENLAAAASQMGAPDKSRPGPGPPPLLYLLSPRPPPLPQRPVRFTVALRPEAGASGGGSSSSNGWPGGSGPFLYDPFSAKREQAAAKSQDGAAGPAQWVCGEVAGVEVEVCNPAAVGMRIDKMVLEAAYLGDASMAPREYMTITSSTQVAWKPKPVSLNIPANTKPVRIVLEGTPLLKGMLVLTGCRLTAFGGVSWFQPWSKPPSNAAQQLSYSRRDAGSSGAGGSASSANVAGVAGASGDVTAAPEARVAVVEPLPLVQLGLQPGQGAGGSSQQEGSEALGMLSPGGAAAAVAAAAGTPTGGAASAAGAPPPALRLLQGQVYSGQLTVTNTSKAPVAWASVNVRKKEPSSRLSVAVDSAALLAQLPLAAGQSCSIAVTFAAGVRASHAAEEVLTAEICLEYVGPDAAGPLLQNGCSGDNGSSSGSGGGAQTVLGRHAVLPVEVHVQPSVQVAQVQFRELYLPCAPAAAAAPEEQQAQTSSSSAGSSTTFERRCVMEVVVANRGRWPLQVWLGPNVPEPTQLASAAQQDALLPPAVPAAAEGLPSAAMLAPGRRCTVAYILDAACTSTDSSSSSGSSAAGPRGGAGAGGAAGGRLPATFEEQQRQACAERLCHSLALFYRVDAEEAGIADTAVGMAPLVHGEVYNGLSYHSLAMLQPCAVTVCLSAAPLHQQEEQQQQAVVAPVALQLLAPPEADQHVPQQQQQQHLQQQSPYCRFPAFASALGQPLSVTLSVTNHGPAAASSSIGGGGDSDAAGTAGNAADDPAAAGSSSDGLDLQLDAAVSCHPVRGSEQEEAAAAGGGGGGAAAASHDLNAVWAGQLWTGLRLTVKPGQTVSQRLGLCLLAPGLYQIGLQHWQCSPVGPAAAALQQQQSSRKKGAPPGPLVNTMVDVQPCFVLAQ